MNIDEVLLNKDDSQTLMNNLSEKGIFLSAFAGDKTWENALCKAQCLKLLDVLKKERMIDHSKNWNSLDDTYPLPCYQDCKLCKIEKLLKEEK